MSGWHRGLCAIARDESFDGDGLVVLITDAGPCHASRREIRVSRDQAVLRPPPMRYRLPYGKWTCAEGREVLFNREYRAIWQRYPGQHTAAPCDLDEWVEWTGQKWFFKDHNPPWTNKRSAQICEEILADFGVPPPLLVNGPGFIAAAHKTLWAGGPKR